MSNCRRLRHLRPMPQIHPHIEERFILSKRINGIELAPSVDPFLCKKVRLNFP
jgi:hypothetical protein